MMQSSMYFNYLLNLSNFFVLLPELGAEGAEGTEIGFWLLRPELDALWFGVWVVGCGVWGLRFRVHFGVQRQRFTVLGLDFLGLTGEVQSEPRETRCGPSARWSPENSILRVYGPGFGVYGSEFRV